MNSNQNSNEKNLAYNKYPDEQYSFSGRLPFMVAYFNPHKSAAEDNPENLEIIENPDDFEIGEDMLVLNYSAN